ncbi:MAG: glycosyl transferase, partial [Gemmataceae bacterium]
MVRKRILMACSNYWNSPFQVGSHHLARGFARAGWQVAFLSDPQSPWHLCGGLSRDLWRRLGSYARGGDVLLDGNL